MTEEQLNAISARAVLLDAGLVAHARADVVVLLAEVRRLREEQLALIEQAPTALVDTLRLLDDCARDRERFRAALMTIAAGTYVHSSDLAREVYDAARAALGAGGTDR
jgi:hypothetical protein